MQFDAKDRQVINFLLEEKRWISIEYLCKKLKFSRSNLNYHLEHINKILKKNNITPINLRTKEILNFNEISDFYQQIITKKGNIFLNSTERQLIIIILLIFNKITTLKKLSCILGVSINTIFNDIQELKENNYIKHLHINFKVNKKGHSISADLVNLQKLLINAVLELTELDQDKNIILFLIQNLQFDDFLLLKRQQISPLELFKTIENLVQEFYQELSFKNFQEQTVSLLVYIIFTKKFAYKELGASKNILPSKKMEFLETSWYQISSKIIEGIIVKYELYHTNIGHFEKLYLAQVISSHHAFKANNESLDSNLAIKNYGWYKKYFEKHGYKINTRINKGLFVKVYCYFQILPFADLADGNWLNKKCLTLTDDPIIKKYLQDFKTATLTNPNEHVMINKYRLCLVASIFLLGMTTMPVAGEKIVTKEVVLITNLTSISLNMWIYKVLNTYKNVETYQIISPNFLKNATEMYADKSLITNLVFIANDQLIYIADE